MKTGEQRFVALDIAPIGRLMAPTGDLEFEEAVSLFKEQVEAGVNAGADLIICETFTDVYELKAAVVAVQEVTNLPLLCSVTFQENGRMLMGPDPVTAVYYLQDLGMDAIGVNCSLGPKQMIPIVQQMLQHCKIPFLVQPNAGLPRMENGQTVYDVTAEEYSDIMCQLVAAGVSIAGGCCGTTPQYISLMVEKLKGKELLNGGKSKSEKQHVLATCSATKTVLFDGKIHPVGERINPT